MMRQKNKFTALAALAQTVSRRSIKETAINALKVLSMLVFIVASVLPARGEDCFLITFGPTDIPPGATLSNYVNSPDLGLNNITYDFVTADWKIQGSLLSCSAERIPSEWESDKALMREFYRQNFGVTVKDEANLLVLAQPTADGGYKRLRAIELYQGGNILDCEIVPQECTKNAYCVGVSVESMSPVYAEQLRLQKEIIDKKCADGPVDECAEKIPRPKEVQILSPDITVIPVLGADPENISPLGFGNIAEGGKDFTLRAGLCPFEVPMTFLFMYAWNATPYVMGADNKIIKNFINDNITDGVLPPSTDIEDYLWKSNVDGSISEEISGDFGGLFVDTKHLPRGSTFYLAAFSLGSVPADIPGMYMWTYDLEKFIDVSCEGNTPQPAGKEIYFVKPAAVPVSGSDPKKIQPFSVGPYALGGDLLAMSVDFCQFDGWVDTHFGIYCPSEDLFNIYFVNSEAETEQDIFQKVSLFKFLFSGELPPFAQSTNWDYDNTQSYPTNFFAGFSSGLPKKRCYYIAAVSPAGVRDKFYAWILPLDVNIKNAMAEYLLNKN